MTVRYFLPHNEAQIHGVPGLCLNLNVHSYQYDAQQHFHLVSSCLCAHMQLNWKSFNSYVEHGCRAFPSRIFLSYVETFEVDRGEKTRCMNCKKVS